jgi:hypothetical protein
MSQDYCKGLAARQKPIVDTQNREKNQTIPLEKITNEDKDKNGKNKAVRKK